MRQFGNGNGEESTGSPLEEDTEDTEDTLVHAAVAPRKASQGRRRTPRGRRAARTQRPAVLGLAVVALLFATGCAVLTLAGGPGVYNLLGLGLMSTGQSTASPSAHAKQSATPIPFSPIDDGPTYVSKSTMPTPTGLDPSHATTYGCPNGAPQPAPFNPIFGKTHTSYATVQKEIALTFDDGPSNADSDTPQLLHWLEANHIPATFFVVGVRVRSDPSALQEAYRDGFEIGVHTWDHPDMTHLSIAQMQREFASTISVIHQYLGPQACVWLWRPPYGAYNSAVLSEAQRFNLTSIMWDVDPTDWASPGTNVITRRVEAAAHPGAIILEHDGPGSRWQTLAAVQQYVPYLQAQGYHFVTVSQLIEDSAYSVWGPSGPPTATPTPHLLPHTSTEGSATLPASALGLDSRAGGAVSAPLAARAEPASVGGSSSDTELDAAFAKMTVWCQ